MAKWPWRRQPVTKRPLRRLLCNRFNLGLHLFLARGDPCVAREPASSLPLAQPYASFFEQSYACAHGRVESV
eukprot:scaffold237646_cov31-Tisochrysis_lutea.AAC.3